jgi:mannose PTS system EIIA component
MIGLLIISHCELGRELLRAAELIMGRLENAESIAITQTCGSREMIDAISKKIKTMHDGDGILILTDMFGGTPSNLSLSFLGDENVEVLTGVNLPMVISAAQDRTRYSLSDLGERAKEAGKRSIALAGQLLKAE